MRMFRIQAYASFYSDEVVRVYLNLDSVRAVAVEESGNVSISYDNNTYRTQIALRGVAQMLHYLDFEHDLSLADMGVEPEAADANEAN